MFYAKKSTIEELKNFVYGLVEENNSSDEYREDNPYSEALCQRKIPRNGYSSDTFGIKDADYNGIMFDMENFISPEENDSYGYKQIGDFAVAFCKGGGDWEWPAVNFVLYLGEDNKIHAYTPTEGNTYNKITDTAYAEELDYCIDKNKLKEWNKFAAENGFIEDYDQEDEDCDEYIYCGEEYDAFIEDVIRGENLDKMIEDIKKNIVVR